MVHKDIFSCVKIKYTTAVPFSQQLIDDLEEVIENI